MRAHEPQRHRARERGAARRGAAHDVVVEQPVVPHDVACAETDVKRRRAPASARASGRTEPQRSGERATEPRWSASLLAGQRRGRAARAHRRTGEGRRWPVGRRGAVAGRPDSRTGSSSRSAGDLTSDPKASSVTTFWDQNRRQPFRLFSVWKLSFFVFPWFFENEEVVGCPRMPRSPGEGQNGIAASVYRGGPPPTLERSSHSAEFHQRGEAAKSDAQR